MEMEGRGYSDFYRNTSEELFIKSMMETSSPSIEILGFKNRIDSEELFRTWLTTADSNFGHSPGGAIGQRPRQASRRISTELASLTNQNMVSFQKRTNDNTVHAQNDSANGPNSIKAEVEKGSNRFLAKAWFHSSQPMTRSRSSELRRRYAAMQNSQTPFGIEAASVQLMSANSVRDSKQETTDANGLNALPVFDNATQFNGFMSPSNSSSSNFHNSQMDNISSVVSMLKGTLERKKLSNHIEKEDVDDSSFGYYATDVQQQGVQAYENCGIFQDVSTLGVAETEALQTIEDSLMEVIDPVNSTRSEFSVEPTVCESSRNHQMGNRPKDLRDPLYDNSKDNPKKGGLIRYGSMTSDGSVGDPTKKRRVERSRKMAEAKERSSTPAVATDIQSVMKRCENLEKEVRSLKLNLAFMNRKDSEQTKEIEELQKQNQELGNEKERLLQEIERIIGDNGNIHY